MYPPVAIGQMRVSYSHDIVLGGQLSVPAGTVLWVPHHAMQNVSFNWDEPEKFLPGAPCTWLTGHQNLEAEGTACLHAPMQQRRLLLLP